MPTANTTHRDQAEHRTKLTKNLAASVRTSSALASMDIDAVRFPRVDGVHRSAGYESAADRADIEIAGALASFAVR